MAIYPAEYRPLATSDLIRVGAPFDGGYVLPERIIGATRGLLSFGLCDDWTFEEEVSRAGAIPVVCFDPSVDRVFWLRKFAAGIGRGLLSFDLGRMRRGFRFIDYMRFFDGKRNRHVALPIGNGLNAVALQQAMLIAKLPEPLFLKMDIEGWEYRILDDLVRVRQRFVGMAIEFHDVDLHEARILKFMRDIGDSHLLVHFHANSHTAIGPEGSALVFEMTFMNRTLLRSGEKLEHRALPIQGLDAPNLKHNEEAAVAFREVA